MSEDRSADNTDIGGIIESAKQVITNPEGFYSRMPTTGGFVNPLIFVVVMAIVSALIMAVLSVVGLGALGGAAVGIGILIAAPIGAAIGSFIGAALLFVLWKLLGSDQNYETAYRCAAYGMALYPINALLSMVPYLGSLVGLVWGLYLMFVASKVVHKIPHQKALVAFCVIGVVFGFFNISSEIAARKMTAQFEGITQQMEGLEDMNPEEAGRAVGQFLKGIEQGSQ